MDNKDISIMDDKEREVYLRRMLMESAVIDEQIEKAQGKELVYGENYGMIPLKEFVQMHPEYAKYVVSSFLEKDENEADTFVAVFGEGKYVFINNGIIAGRSENGSFTPSEKLPDEIGKTSLQEMLDMTHLGILNENDTYLKRYQDNYNKKALNDRMPKTMEDYLLQVSQGNLLVTKEEFRDTLGLTASERNSLDEYQESVSERDEEPEEELEEGNEEREYGRRDDEERDETERDAVEKTEEEIAEKSLGDESVIDEAQKDENEYEGIDIEKLYEERAKLLAEGVLKKFNVPVRARGQLVEFFIANPDMDINSLKQVMEVRIPNVDRDDEGFALRFASKDVGLKDRIVVFQEKRVIDERKFDHDIEQKMDEEYAKAPVDVINDKKQMLVYTDFSGNTTCSELKKKDMNDLTKEEGNRVIREFEEIQSAERALIAERMSMSPEVFSQKMTALGIRRLKVIGEYGLSVPEVHKEIEADKELSSDIEQEMRNKKPEKPEDKDEDEDWIRGRYNSHHGMM